MRDGASFGHRALTSADLERIMSQIGLDAPMPVKARAHEQAWKWIKIRIDAPPVPVYDTKIEQRLFGIPITVDDSLETNEVRIEMTDGSERTYRL